MKSSPCKRHRDSYKVKEYQHMYINTPLIKLANASHEWISTHSIMIARRNRFFIYFRVSSACLA